MADIISADELFFFIPLSSARPLYTILHTQSRVQAELYMKLAGIGTDTGHDSYVGCI